MALAQLLLYLRLDVLLCVQHRDLPLHVHQHPAQPVFDGECLEQLLALQGLNVEMSCDEIGKRTGVAHTLEYLLHDVGRQAGLLAQFARPLADFAMQRDESSVLLVEGGKV